MNLRDLRTLYFLANPRANLHLRGNFCIHPAPFLRAIGVC